VRQRHETLLKKQQPLLKEVIHIGAGGGPGAKNTNLPKRGKTLKSDSFPVETSEQVQSHW